MKYIATIMLVLALNSSVCVKAESKYSIFLTKIREIEFKDTYVTDALEFMREKGTEIHKDNGTDNYILSFEYAFDPSKLRKRITLRMEKVTYRTAIDSIVTQAGLKYEVKKDRITFTDKG